MHTIDLEPYQYSGTNITGIRLVDPENPMMEHITNCMAELEGDTDEEESEEASEEIAEKSEDEEESESCKVNQCLFVADSSVNRLP